MEKRCYDMEKLKAILQFILKDSMARLQREGQGRTKQASFARGASIENILASFFQVPGAVDEAASEVYVIDALLEQGNAEEAQKAIEALRDRFGEIPALSMLDFRLQLLKK